MQSNKIKILQNTIFWGFILWLFGYILGIIFFAFVPKEHIGFYILPLGTAFTLWVLIKKIKRDEPLCYVGLGIIWMLMAASLDYVFIVKLFKSTDYYKTDVYLYNALTFFMPIIYGLFLKSKGRFPD